VIQVNLPEQQPLFCGYVPTANCRVCGGLLSDRYVESGVGAYLSRWIRCIDCGSWSISTEPHQEMLDIFYRNYLLHGKLSAVHSENNDGRRYTNEYRAIRESEYRIGMNDVGLELNPGCDLLDFGGKT